MQKDADAYRTISEVAETLDIPPHVLRFWETKFPQIKPLKRGGGRRYYRRNDTDLLRSIRRLLYDEGYTIRGVQRLLKAQGGVAALIQNQASPSVNLPTADVQDAADANPAGAAAEGPDKTLSETIIGLRSEIDACRAILQEAARAVQ